MNLRERFLKLQAALVAHEGLWRPAPFHVRRPAWCDEQPALADAVRALDATTLDALVADPDAARAWLAPRLPVVAALARLTDVGPLPARALAPCDPHFDWAIPGRKRSQIEAFALHSPPAAAPLLEWCSGKGHLGRRLAIADRVGVASLELDAALCRDAARLAARAGIEQRIVHADALAPDARDAIAGRVVVALHACGELHRTLARGAARDGARGYRVAPCCYHLGAPDGYRPLGGDAALQLDADALRLAVTETVTAPARIRERVARDQAWKLGFAALRAALEGERKRTFRPVPRAWLAGDFRGFCEALAQRERVRLPAAVDWAHWVAAGERRRDEVRRYELVRHAFRRALEVWLVADLALGFEAAGFEARIGTFCARSLTPRNLMVVAAG